MNVSLNLLPEKHRANIRRTYYDRFFFHQSVMLFFICLFYVATIGSVFFVVRQNRLAVETMSDGYADATAEMRELERYENAFRETNVESAGKARLYREHLFWSELLVALDETVPQGIVLSSLSTKEYRVYLSGIAATRNDFLALEAGLRGQACLSDFEIPVSNLFSREHVEFQMDFSISPECLKRSSDL